VGTALYIRLEREIPDLDLFVDGKTLCKESDTLDSIAAELGVKPLMEFFSASPDEINDFLEGEHARDLVGVEKVQEVWFDPEDGLKTVRALLVALRENPEILGDTEGVVLDLLEFERVLSEAKENNVKWHLSVDF